MPPAVISIQSRGDLRQRTRNASWSLIEIAPSGGAPLPFGILLVDHETGEMTMRMREPASLDQLEEHESDILNWLSLDLQEKARETGAVRLLDSLEDSVSHFFRISDRTPIAYSNPRETVDRLFDEYVDATVRPFISHLPFYTLRAAASKFGELLDREEEGSRGEDAQWVRAPENLRLTEGMFVAYVVGRSMEPRIPDGSACIFRAPVVGSRNGRLLLIEKFGETDFSARYTVKKYSRQGQLVESAERLDAIRLEPLNHEFEAFDLTSDAFRVIAEFVQVLPS